MTIKEIRKLLEAATLKWKTDPGNWYHDCRIGYPIHGSGENDEADAAFIAAAPEAIRFLLEKLELEKLDKAAIAGRHMKDLPEYLALRKERDQLREQLKHMHEAKDALVDRLAEFTTAREINGGEVLLENKLQPEVDQLRKEVERLKKGWGVEVEVCLALTVDRATLKARCEKLEAALSKIESIEDWVDGSGLAIVKAMTKVARKALAGEGGE
jgi:alanyl-tRNA synthetase